MMCFVIDDNKSLPVASCVAFEHSVEDLLWRFVDVVVVPCELPFRARRSLIADALEIDVLLGQELVPVHDRNLHACEATPQVVRQQVPLHIEVLFARRDQSTQTPCDRQVRRDYHHVLDILGKPTRLVSDSTLACGGVPCDQAGHNHRLPRAGCHLASGPQHSVVVLFCQSM